MSQYTHLITDKKEVAGFTPVIRITGIDYRKMISHGARGSISQDTEVKMCVFKRTSLDVKPTTHIHENASGGRRGPYSAVDEKRDQKHDQKRDQKHEDMEAGRRGAGEGQGGTRVLAVDDDEEL